jgi:hypothetical protein
MNGCTLIGSTMCTGQMGMAVFIVFLLSDMFDKTYYVMV